MYTLRFKAAQMVRHKKSKSGYELISREGRVAVERRGNSIKLRWVHNGKTYDRAIALATSVDAVKVAKAKARQIDSDMILGQFDETLAKYLSRMAVKTKEAETAKNNLITHWENYKTYSCKTVQKTTQADKWKQVDRSLAKIDPSLLSLDKADKLMQALLEFYSPNTVNRIFSDILAAINLAIKQDKLLKNPYRLCKEFLNKLCRSESNGEGEFKRTREIWSSNELEAIFDAFATNTYCSSDSVYRHDFYLPYIKFLAFSGCRPEEAIALTKTDVFIKNDKHCLRIDKAHTRGFLKCTKTEKAREIILNDELMDCITEGSKIYSGNLIFPSAKGTYICQDNFQKRHFKKVVTGLFLDGKVSKILPTYNLRHTRITSLLADGVPPVTVAQLMGTSPEMIYSHYCGNIIESYQMPPLIK
ncbi:MAG: tyrosine-type recombinase/integrase [Limnoraphis robusta]